MIFQNFTKVLKTSPFESIFLIHKMFNKKNDFLIKSYFLAKKTTEYTSISQ